MTQEIEQVDQEYSIYVFKYDNKSVIVYPFSNSYGDTLSDISILKNNSNLFNKFIQSMINDDCTCIELYENPSTLNTLILCMTNQDLVKNITYDKQILKYSESIYEFNLTNNTISFNIQSFDSFINENNNNMTISYPIDT